MVTPAGVQAAACVLLGSLVVLSCAQTIYHPPQCQKVCSAGVQDVSKNDQDFLTVDPGASGNPPEFKPTRASQWGVTMLKAIRDSLGDGALTPPSIARYIGLYSMVVYQGFAVWSPSSHKFAPLSSEILNVNIPDDYLRPAAAVPTDPDQVLQAQQAAISGAASRFITLFWQGQKSWNSTVQAHVDAAMAQVGLADKAADPVAFQQGETIADGFYSLFQVANLLQDTADKLPPELANITSSQPTAAVTDCAKLQRGWWFWQRLTVPASNSTFVPGPGAVLPNAAYANLTVANGNAKTPFFRGYAALYGSPLLKATTASSQPMLEDLNGPPGEADPTGYDQQMQGVLDASAELDDVNKVIAEYWADGPDSTTPPGHWFRIALQESSSTMNIGSDVALDKAVWATLNVGLALHEAGMLAWQLKVKYMGARPITGIQCRLSQQNNGTGTAWLGPYMGVGSRQLSTWQPYQVVTFVTPPFSGYVSGHATFSGAAAEALRSYRDNFNQSMAQPAYNCYKTPAGYSKVEPLIPPGQPGYVAGYTDVPNKGPNTVGYAPSQDVVLCWESYMQAAQQAADSRIYGGIHISKDNDDGLVLGKRIGGNVGAITGKLLPINTVNPEPISSRTPVAGGAQWGVDYTYICPQGSFITEFRGASGDSVDHVIAVCSNGAELPRAGGAGNAPFAVASSYGFAGVDVWAGSWINAVQFVDLAGMASPLYGNANGGSASRLVCPDGERAVGITGNANWLLDSFGILCGKIPPPQNKRRFATVVRGGMHKGNSYNITCPPGTFVIRWNGGYSRGALVNSISATCSNGVLLPAAGGGGGMQLPTQSSMTGYSGIKVWAGLWINAIAFISSTGAVSPRYGKVAHGKMYTINCPSGTRVVGTTGKADWMMVSIGLICERIATIPSSVRFKTEGRGDAYWGTDFDRQCGPGTFITRWDGTAGGSINSITATCSNNTSLARVGSDGGSPFTASSSLGYRGINVRAESVLDCIAFTSTAGSVTPAYGNITGATMYTLSCPPGCRAVGMYGKADSVITYIGLWCEGSIGRLRSAAVALGGPGVSPLNYGLVVAGLVLPGTATPAGSGDSVVASAAAASAAADSTVEGDSISGATAHPSASQAASTTLVPASAPAADITDESATADAATGIGK